MKDTFYPTGYVKLYDANTSELLYEGHNMIVQGGRDFIRNCFLSSLIYSTKAPDNNSDPRYYVRPTEADVNFGEEEEEENQLVTEEKQVSADFQNYTYFLSVLLGSDGSATTLNMDALINPQTEATIPFTDADTTDISFEASCMKITVRVEPKPGQDYIARELGLGLKKIAEKDHSNTDPILFSRIAFDPIPVNASSKFTLEYYVYF